MRTVSITCSLFLLALISCKSDATPKSDVAALEVREWQPEDERSMSGALADRGLIYDSEDDTPGYVLYEPPTGTVTFLIDKQGEVVHRWESDLNSMNSYLQPSGHLIRMERDENFTTFAAGGQSGRIREYDWDGNILWDFEYHSETYLTHHDIEVMPNGNILAISYDALSEEEAIEAGMDPKHVPKAGIWLDKIIEIEPIRPKGGKIVWEWRMQDHLVQDLYPEKKNYGNVSENPRKLNINIQSEEVGSPISQERLDQMKEMGFLTSNATLDNRGSDVTHTNAVSYNPELDQIVISVPGYGEIYVIDHSTTTEEARRDSGGRWGHGGELLYRWGNPANYDRGTEEDQKLFGQHDSKWIPKGYPGAGHLMVYNNDIPHPDNKLPNMWASLAGNPSPAMNVAIGDVGNYSAVYEWSIPSSEPGVYTPKEDGAFGPEEPDWTYTAPDLYSLYSAFISGAHRLENGHTFITQGMQGRLIEVDENGDLVWEYWTPYKFDYTLPDGSPAQPTGPFIFGLFRATLYPEDHPAFTGRTLDPIVPQPEHFVLEMPPAEEEPVQ